MKSRFVKSIFQNKENGCCVFVYHTEDEEIPDSAKSKYYRGKGYMFMAVGNHLPDTDGVEVKLYGNWVKNSYGTQLQVEMFEEIRPQTEEGIFSYLSSGMIKGIGPKTAKLIVAKYGMRTFEILDNYPDSLLSIKGITEKKLETILESYHGNRTMRDLAAYLTPFHVTPKKIQKIFKKFGKTVLDIVRKEPFRLCEISGFGFLTVDEIAKANKCPPNDPMRIEGCIHYCSELGMQEGHLFFDKQSFQRKVYEQLNHGYQTEAVTEQEVYRVLYDKVMDGEFYYENNAFYPAKLYQFECGAASALVDLLIEKSQPVEHIDVLIDEAQRELGIQLSLKQSESVKKAFTHLVSMITGGPGTGKTTVQKVLLYIYEKLGGQNVLLTAPTGRASRRMAESTGRTEAVTMHSAMGLTSEEDREAMEGTFEADFIIADEFTMSNMRLSYEFFKHIKKGTRLILVGDINQLPSVGPGNVFRELILCGVIPVTKLDMVFRQAENSRIAVNAYRMQENSMNGIVLKDAMIRRSDKLAHAAYQYFMILLGIDENKAEEQFPWDSVLLEQLLDTAIEILKEDGFTVCNPRVISENCVTRLCTVKDCGCRECFTNNS